MFTKEQITLKVLEIIKNHIDQTKRSSVIIASDRINELIERYALDSLDMAEIIIDIEYEFGINISDEDSNSWNNIHDIVKTIITKTFKSLDFSQSSNIDIDWANANLVKKIKCGNGIKYEPNEPMISFKHKAIITTSANPFHYGHLDLFNKAKEIFNDVEVIIAQNSEKHTMKNIESHMECYNIPYKIIKGITVADYCKENHIKYIIRGIRNGVDAEYELKLDFANKEINPDIQTIFIPTNDTFANISSSTIRELLKYKKFDIVKKYMNEEAMKKYIIENTMF